MDYIQEYRRIRRLYIKLYDLPQLPWEDTQLVYHALARRNEECLVLTSTREPYACIGFAQDIKEELDLEYCQNNGIGYFRRETGGGTVYLDENQIFYQVIVRRDNPLVPYSNDTFFKRFLEPVVKVLERLGLKAEFVPINDILVDGKKISGNGGGEIGDCKVLVGNILLDFDFQRMADILGTPNREFKSRVFSSMKNNMTTLKSELENVPSKDVINQMLREEYEDLLGSLIPSEIGHDIQGLMKDLDRKFSTDEWLFQKVPKKKDRDVKIREGINIVFRAFAGVDWKVDIIFEVKNGKIIDIELWNAVDFTIHEDDIKSAMFENNFDEKEILNTLNELYETHQGDTEGYK